MKSVNGKILVSVNLAQKDYMEVGGVELKTAMPFASNFREKTPVIAKVIEGNEFVMEGNLLLTHHNLFQMPSPYHLYDELFSIPFSKVLFAKIDTSGDIQPICGNLICEKIEVETLLPVPENERKYHINKYKVLMSGWTNYKEGSIIYTRPNSGYEIIYILNGKKNIIVKVDSDMICGVSV